VQEREGNLREEMKGSGIQEKGEEANGGSWNGFIVEDTCCSV